jgi:hypothetical protein
LVSNSRFISGNDKNELSIISKLLQFVANTHKKNAQAIAWALD